MGAIDDIEVLRLELEVCNVHVEHGSLRGFINGDVPAFKNELQILLKTFFRGDMKQGLSLGGKDIKFLFHVFPNKAVAF